MRPIKENSERIDPDADYDEMKRLARHRDPSVRSSLMQRSDVRPEIAYFLACDPSPEVRRAVATSVATPPQANLLLARDPDQEVREALARKVAKLVPFFGEDERKQLQRHVIETVEQLAKDQATRVRALLAELLGEEEKAPREVIQRLARDTDELVANPVLQFSPLLSESDLIEIIDASCPTGKLTAISRRHGLGAQVADAIVETSNELAITALLENHSAQIREQTLDELVERAAKITAWHAPLVYRPQLPTHTAEKLASFVADHLVRKLQERKDLDSESAKRISAELHRRLSARPAKEKDSGEDDGLKHALTTGDGALARSRLASLSGFPERVIERVLTSGSARAISALCWKSGLGMSTALQVQLRMAGLSPSQALHPRSDGGYPLGREEMAWQLEFFESLAK